MIHLKVCAKCKQCFPMTDSYFHRNKRLKNGFHDWCKVCHAEYKRHYRKENADKIREYGKNWSQANSKKSNGYQNKYRENNREKIRDRSQKWVRENPEKARKARKKCYRKMMENPNCRINRSVRTAIGESLRDNKNGRHWESLVGFTLNDLMIHLERQFTKGMIWNNHGEWHIDHIRPIADFDFTSPDDLDFKACWSLWNLQPLWAKDNLSKNARCEAPPLPLI